MDVREAVRKLDRLIGRKVTMSERVAIVEATDLYGIWQVDPRFIHEHYPKVLDERGEFSMKRAVAYMLKKAKKRYANGKCGLCGGSARACAPRHAVHRSCD